MDSYISHTFLYYFKWVNDRIHIQKFRLISKPHLRQINISCVTDPTISNLVSVDVGLTASVV
jgi:hypothetical protein